MKKYGIYLFLSLFVILIASGAYLYKKLSSPPENKALQYSSKDFLKTDTVTTSRSGLNMPSESREKLVRLLDSISTYIEQKRRRMGGEKITIAIIGIDSRLGPDSKHADANHVLTFWLDSGYVDIVSVPRCVEADCGYPDTTTFNILAVYRATFGRKAFIPKLAEFAGVNKVDYYIEFGFSQALRLMEMLGFKDKSAAMLRVLRSRKSFIEDDYQRSYNQGQFIRQMILSQFHKTEGMTGDLLLRASLMMVETNLTYEKAKYISSKMEAAGFPKSAADISVVTRPAIGKLRVFDFVNDSSRKKLYEYVNSHTRLSDTSRRSLDLSNTGEISRMVSSRLARAIENAEREKMKPARVVTALQIFYEQRAWNQISLQDGRTGYRDKICGLLSDAYIKMGKQATANQILDFLAVDKKVDNLAQ